VIAAFLGINVWLIGYYYRVRRQTSQATWEELLARLTLTDRDNIARLALELVDESGERREVEDAAAEAMGPERIWGMIGGLEGLEVLEKNSEVLIDLAAYVQRWYPEALVIAERLRLDARELKWHVTRLRGAAQTGNLQVSFPFYAQRAVASYYLMTRRLLSLYESASFPMLADLQRAL
jgi:hypothetical protein